jgi:hypothetical protein
MSNANQIQFLHQLFNQFLNQVSKDQQSEIINLIKQHFREYNHDEFDQFIGKYQTTQNQTISELFKLQILLGLTKQDILNFVKVKVNEFSP